MPIDRTQNNIPNHAHEEFRCPRCKRKYRTCGCPGTVWKRVRNEVCGSCNRAEQAGNEAA